MKCVLSVDDLDTEFVGHIFGKTDFFKRARLDRSLDWHHIGHLLDGRLMITDFFEPSTRTRLSFEAAMSYMGGKVIGTENAGDFSSIAKGESISDNFQVISGYCDVIVGRFRHEGEARIAASACDVPLINGGDGKGEHPTQALVDAYIIEDKLGDRDSLTITFIGDNEHSRTVRSLARLFGQFDNVTLNIMESPILRPSTTWRIHNGYDQLGSPINLKEITHGDFTNILERTDVVYLTRDQVERHIQNSLFAHSRDKLRTFVFDTGYASLLPKHALILHPLPRNQELPIQIDNDPRAHYFEQARNGLYVRMALLDSILNGY